MPADNSLRVEGDIVEQAVWRPFMVVGTEGEEMTMWAWASEAPCRGECRRHCTSTPASWDAGTAAKALGDTDHPCDQSCHAQ